MSVNLLFVCLGNICRSPTAEAIMTKLANDNADLNIKCDSCGTANFHQGQPADSRMISHAKKRNIHLTSISRGFDRFEDFEKFDYILCMDHQNYQNILLLSDDSNQHKVYKMTDFCSTHTIDHVPDPYYGGSKGFDNVIDILEDACDGLIKN